MGCIMIVSLDSSEKIGKNNKSFYGVVQEFCALNDKIHCLNILPVDSSKTFKNDTHLSNIGTEYIANIIQDYLNDVNFLKQKNH